MASRRKTIRDRLKDILNGNTDAGPRVYKNRSIPTWHEELSEGPVIIIWTLSESTEKYAESPREFKRELSMIIEIIATGQEDDVDAEPCELFLEDKLDMLSSQVDCLLLASDTLGCDAEGNGFVDNIEPVSIEFDYEDSGKKPIGSARMTFIMTYYDVQPATLDKISGLSDFKTVAADWSVGHHDSEPDDIVETSDLVAIPQT